MNSASHCRRYCDNCQKKSRSRNTKHMREMMRSRRNFQADESSCPAAWNTTREFPDFIGSATEPSSISGSEFEAEIKAFLSRGGKIQYLPIMPADTTGHEDHQVYLIGKYE